MTTTSNGSNSNMETLVSMMANTLATSLKMLNKLDKNDQKISEKADKIQLSIQEESEKVIATIQNQLVTKVDAVIEDQKKRHKETSDALKNINDIVVELVHIIAENSEDETLAEAKADILDAVQRLDYKDPIVALIQSLTAIQDNFEQETQHLQVIRQDINNMSTEFNRLTHSNRVLSARISSIDVRTSLLADINKEDIQDDDSWALLDEQIELLKQVNQESNGLDFD